jgi:hypothetical protein
MLNIPIPQVQNSETIKFSKEWTYNGVAVTLDNTTIQFATDFSNVLLKQFAIFLGQILTPIPAQAKREIAPLEPEKSSIIIEG